MFGWRARLGLIIPSANTVNEPEFYRYVPDGVSVHTARMHHTTASVENQLDMSEKMLACADRLETANVDVVVFGCTTGSLVRGAGYEEVVESELSERAGGVPAVATAASINRAFDALGVDSLVATTPYPAELDEREAEFLEESGFEVLDIEGLGMESAVAKGDLGPERAYREARRVARDEADCVFVSCTNYRTFEVINALERDLDTPVVTSNQATLWDALRTADVDYSDVDLGELFAH